MEPALYARVRAVRRHRVALLVALACLAAGQRLRAEPRCLDDAEVCLDVRDEGRTISFVVANHEAAPYTVQVLLPERSNLEPLSPLPFRTVVEAGERKMVGVLAARRADEPTRYALRWGAAPGDARARPDPSVRYGMPFGGKEPRVVTQGPGESTSHRGAASQAIDFAMPWGTPVLAARSGRVIAVVDGHTRSGLRADLYDQANRVDVLHADGTIATYAHLRSGAEVEVGQQVATGERIGTSGDSGYSGGPHLHFMLWKRDADLSATGVPVRFHDGSAQGFVPAVGVACAPACAQSGVACAPGQQPPPPEALPARRADASPRAQRRADGACACANGALIHVDLPCDVVCPR